MQRTMLAVLLSGLLIGSVANAADTLADKHSAMTGCVACHGTNEVKASNIPDDEYSINKACQGCHGSYDNLPKKIQPLILTMHTLATSTALFAIAHIPNPSWSATTVIPLT